MSVKFVGKHPDIEWVETGFYSLDIALRKNHSQIGWPTRTLAHIYGPTSTGKSTFINSISCVIGKKLGLGIACLDFETQDPQTIEAIAENLGFDGEWIWVEPKKKDKKGGDLIDDSGYTDEYLLGLLRKQTRNNNITILDSVGSVVPLSESKGNVGDANMGRRAFNMAQYTRLMNRELKWSDKGTMSFMANHKYGNIATGLAFKTFHAPGGEVKENMSFINIEAKTPYIEIGDAKKLAHFGEGWLFEGKVIKNRFGLSHSDFWVFILGGQGIHKGLTAMFDCVKLGFAEIKTGAKLVMKETGEDFGRVSKIIAERDEFDFGMFHNLLKAHQLSAEDDAKLKVETEEVEYVQDEK